MKNDRLTYIKNIILPCLVFSVITGIFTGALIFLFKICASAVISLSQDIYAFVRTEPIYLPLLVLGAAAIALLSALILKLSHNCRGGGIPTAVAILRGLITFHWLKSIFMLFASAMLTYLGGIPLGNEGPSVQMGTAVGRGTVRIFGKKNEAWDRYIMTGGACAGFAAATGAPISGIFFALEEAHRRFSPMICMVASTAVIAGTATMEFLCSLAGISSSMFSFTADSVLPLKYIWSQVAVGVVCGVSAILFTKLYRSVSVVIGTKLHKLPFTVKIVTVFVLVSLIGFVSADCLGSGHSLIEAVAEGHGVWYLILLYLCVRAILLIVANNAGVTGGLFVPSLAFGAMIGALCGQALTALNLIPDQYFTVTVITGMASFLSASSRTPITAIIFSVEALCGFSNILPITAGVTFAFLVIEAWGITSFTDTVIEGKVKRHNAGKVASVIDTHLTVQRGSFAVGKEIRDILWPPTCTVLSIQKAHGAASGTHGGIEEGDVLHVHYQTYDECHSTKLLEAILGKQSKDLHAKAHTVNDDHVVPEL